MAFSEVLAPCRGCHQERPFRQHHADHLLHLLLTIFTGGLWLPVWLLAVWYPGKYRCAACGMKYKKPRRPLSPYFVAFGVVALVLLTIGVFRGFSGNSRSRPVAVVVSKPVEKARTFPTTISAADLAQAFRDTPRTAAARYADVAVVVSGEAKLVAPVERDGQTRIVFVDNSGEQLAECLVNDCDITTLRAYFAGQEHKPVTLRCRLLRSTPDGALTLHQAQLVK